MRRGAAVTFFALLLAAGCGGREEPVAALSVEPKDVKLPAGQAAGWKLTWNPKAPLDNLEGKPRVFVHLLASGRNLLRTFDHPLPEEWTPWKAQSYEIELYQSALAEPLPAGAYELTAGLYDDASGERWALDSGDAVGKREYRVATVVVPAAEAGTPTYDFTGGWLDAEPGGSKQVITRRCAQGEATIAVRGVASPGTVVLGASVPKLASGSWGGAVDVTASCAAERAQVNGPELQWARVPIAPSASEPACEIRFAPVPTATGGNARSVCLEILAWRPSGG
ncbi:MAG: hypothetical protein ABI610_07505 [Acidobacteriota bacterium]